MPASSEKQRRFMCSDMDRAEKGEKTQTGMGVGKLKEYCHSKKAAHHTPGDGTGMDASGVPSENALTAEHGPARRR